MESEITDGNELNERTGSGKSKCKEWNGLCCASLHEAQFSVEL